MKKNNGGFLIITLAFLFISFNAQAADRYVRESGNDSSNDCTNSASPCATIDHAVDQSINGDTVKIAQGTYHEGITLLTSVNPLTIQGGWNEDFSQHNEDPAPTIIDGDGVNRVFRIGFSLGTANVAMECLTITGGYNASSGGGIYASAQDETISLALNNLILELNNGGNEGGAIYVSSSGSGNMTFTAENCIVRQNEANYGAGMDISSSNNGITTATIKNSFITDNGTSTNGGALCLCL